MSGVDTGRGHGGSRSTFFESGLEIKVVGLDSLRAPPKDVAAGSLPRTKVKRTLCFDQNDMLLHDLFICQADINDKTALQDYLKRLKRGKGLTKRVVTPGGFKHESISAVVEVKDIIREIYFLIKALHREGFSLSAPFGLHNFAVEERNTRVTVKFSNLPKETLLKADTVSEKMDWDQFATMVKREIFDGDKLEGDLPPNDIIRWLSMLGNKDLSDLMAQHVLLMSTEESGRALMHWYDEFSDLSEHSEAYKHICRDMASYMNWQQTVDSDEGNALLRATLRKENAKPYTKTFKDLLRLLRNNRHHESRYRYKNFALIVSHDFPTLMSDFQASLFKAGCLKHPS